MEVPGRVSRIGASPYESGRTFFPYTVFTKVAIAIYQAIRPTIRISHPATGAGTHPKTTPSRSTKASNNSQNSTARYFPIFCASLMECPDLFVSRLRGRPKPPRVPHPAPEAGVLR
jgi:hypothetical protein